MFMSLKSWLGLLALCLGYGTFGWPFRGGAVGTGIYVFDFPFFPSRFYFSNPLLNYKVKIIFADCPGSRAPGFDSWRAGSLKVTETGVSQT